MRCYKILPLVITVLTLAACERYIYLDTGKEPEIIASGFLSTADSVHTLIVTKTSTPEKKIATVNEARLQCFVNGRLAGETDSLSEYASYFSEKIRKMEFKASFNPGDVVRIVIEADGLQAEVQEKVPSRMPLLSVDTTSVFLRSGDNTLYRRIEHKINIKDLPGEDNFCRLTMSFTGNAVVDEILGTESQEDSPEVGTELNRISKDIEFDNSYEPVLNKRIDIAGDGENNYYNNQYNIFTDAMFRGGTYSLKVLTRPYSSLTVPVWTYWPGSVNIRISRKVSVKLFSLSRDAYCYMDDLQFDDSNLSDTYLLDDLSYPDNVKGGRGFITIMSVSEYVMELPDIITDKP